ncbi:HAD hydrolase-like protein [Candidatus Dojkabacteria bacterium]|nr:HAD hydrolase-like protein [Candidatus Dojkabacteria bacterium]
MIKNIIFDLGGVIFKTNWQKGADLFNKSIKQFKKITRTNRQKYYDNYCKGTISFNEYANFALKQLKVKINEENKQLFKQSLQIFESPDPNVIEIIKKIKPEILLAVLSNSYNILVQYLETNKNSPQGIHKYFHSNIFLSSQIKAIKQSTKVYKYVIQKLDINPSETLMIDNKEEYLLNAKLTKINTFLYHDPEQLESYLKDLDLLNVL